MFIHYFLVEDDPGRDVKITALLAEDWLLRITPPLTKDMQYFGQQLNQWWGQRYEFAASTAFPLLRQCIAHQSLGKYRYKQQSTYPFIQTNLQQVLSRTVERLYQLTAGRQYHYFIPHTWEVLNYQHDQWTFARVIIPEAGFIL